MEEVLVSLSTIPEPVPALGPAAPRVDFERNRLLRLDCLCLGGFEGRDVPLSRASPDASTAEAVVGVEVTVGVDN